MSLAKVKDKHEFAMLIELNNAANIEVIGIIASLINGGHRFYEVSR